MAKQVVALVADMIFESKIRSTAMLMHLPVRVVRAAEDLMVAAEEASGIIVDLNSSLPEPAAIVRYLRSHHPEVPILAYFSHVQAELKRAAQRAGADRVVPRSVFTENLPEFLRELSGEVAAEPAD